MGRNGSEGAMTADRHVEMVEVGPRVGLQNESTLVSTADKAELIRRAIGYGARRIEVTSFVNPKKVPQLADAEELVALLPAREDVTYIGLVLTRRRSEEHTSELQSLMRISYAVFCLKKKKNNTL